jgi:hypothetical protein
MGLRGCRFGVADRHRRQPVSLVCRTVELIRLSAAGHGADGVWLKVRGYFVGKARDWDGKKDTRRMFEPCAEGHSAGGLTSTATRGVDMTTAATPVTAMRPGDLDERVSARVRPEPLAKGPPR